MIWGGLRGAVGLALALQVAMDHEEVGNKVSFVVCILSYDTFRHLFEFILIVYDIYLFQILIHTAGIVLLTLLFNATTIKSLLKVLGMSEISDAKKAAMNNAVNRYYVLNKNNLLNAVNRIC